MLYEEWPIKIIENLYKRNPSLINPNKILSDVLCFVLL